MVGNGGANLVHAGELGHNFVAVALIDEEALPFLRVLTLHGVGGDEGIEEGIVLLSHRAYSSYI